MTSITSNIETVLNDKGIPDWVQSKHIKDAARNAFSDWKYNENKLAEARENLAAILAADEEDSIRYSDKMKEKAVEIFERHQIQAPYFKALYFACQQDYLDLTGYTYYHDEDENNPNFKSKKGESVADRIAAALATSDQVISEDLGIKLENVGS